MIIGGSKAIPTDTGRGCIELEFVRRDAVPAPANPLVVDTGSFDLRNADRRHLSTNAVWQCPDPGRRVAAPLVDACAAERLWASRRGGTARSVAVKDHTVKAKSWSAATGSSSRLNGVPTHWTRRRRPPRGR
ncbi:hypothetical protein BU52_07755 [Streptomyces toyocaensis]|uniref:Uncharacterized protein n=1 Tax=Streptomyces toyocaensis TaxID=55952 RepID=A0A081XW87_STRTO|nr:hypothetical protein BU52_07755 [Streptomyces toyocaensis]